MEKQTAQTTDPNQLSLPARIKRKQNKLNSAEKHLKTLPKNNNKLSKRLQVKIYTHRKQLAQMQALLESLEKNSGKIIISEKLEMFFKLAKIFKPWLTEEIDDLLKK